MIPAEIRAAFKELRLVARRPQAGQDFGQHGSRQRGAGLEFAQYRAYEPGDEPRRIDWKLYARSDRYFVRDAERDSPLTLWLLIDATASMNQADAARPGWRKLDAAKALAAGAAELALLQRDRCGLIAVGGHALTIIPADSGPRHRDRLQLALAGLTAQGRWPPDTALHTLWQRIGADALVLVLSDGFDEHLNDWMLRLAAAGRELRSIQLLSAEERDFPYTGAFRFRDPETGEERRVDAPAARAEFLAGFARARAALAQRLTAAGIRNVEYLLDQPCDQPLRALFGLRRAAA